jgi:hypothetical protein
MSPGPRARSGALSFGAALFVIASASRVVAQTQHFVDAERAMPFIVEVDDAIDRANGRPAPIHELAYPRPEPEWRGLRPISEVFHRFFSGVVPNDTGIERPSADEHTIDELEVPLGPRASYVLMGAANDHVLTPLHFYQQFDGVHVLRYDLTRHEGGSPFRVALGLAPLYGSLTIVTRHNGVASTEQLPTSMIIGGAAGIDVWYAPRLIQFHARVWALPGADVLHDGAGGVELVESIQLKWRLTEAFHLDPTWPIDLGIIALHVDRGNARAAVYEWAGDFRSPAELREVWQLMGIVELRVD